MSEKLEPKKPGTGIESNYVLNGKTAEVKHLIFHCSNSTRGDMIVYVDHQLDLDWECDDQAAALMEEMPRKGALQKIINGIAAIEPIVHSWPDDLKLMSKRLMGEGIAAVFRDDVDGAMGALKNAQDFVRVKSKQVSRYWTLQGCIAAGAVAAVAGLITLLCRSWLAGQLGQTPVILALCFFTGCIGALLFLLLRIGPQTKVDSTAEKHLHYLEAIARIAGGGIAGVLVGGLVKMGLILPVFTQAGMQTLAMCSAAMIAGASERLVAGIVTNVENSENNKTESP